LNLLWEENTVQTQCAIYIDISAALEVTASHAIKRWLFCLHLGPWTSIDGDASDTDNEMTRVFSIVNIDNVGSY